MSLATGGWPRYKANDANSAYVNFPSVGAVGAVVEWVCNISPVYNCYALVADENGVVYQQSWQGLTAVNPDGTLKWHFQKYQNSYSTGALPECPAIGSDGTIYWTNDDHILYAINPDGTLKWKLNIKNLYYYVGGLGALSILDNNNIVLNDEYNIIIVNSTSLVRRLGDDSRSPLAINSNGFFFINGPYGVRHKDFSYTNIWTITMTTNFSNWTSVTISNDSVYVYWDKYLHALDIDTGYIKWSYDLNKTTNSTSRTNLCYTPDGNIIAVRLEGVCVLDTNGNHLRTIPFTSPIEDMFVDSDGIIYVTARKYYDPPDPTIHSVTAIDKNSGIVYWELDFPSATYSNCCCVSVEGCIYVGVGSKIYKISTTPSNIVSVQCEATSSLTDASTGKTITPLIGGV